MKHAIIIENCNTWNIKQGVDSIRAWMSESPLPGTPTPDIVMNFSNDGNSLIISYENVAPDGSINDDTFKNRIMWEMCIVFLN